MSAASQSLALLNDSYRELRHRKLFWVALALSLLVVVAVGATGVNERGWTIFHWTIEGDLNSSWIKPAAYYKWAFVGLGVEFWLTWVATILALITTAGIVPDLVSSGSIDLLVSKPLSRARLFLTKFAGGLLFATLQVSIFTVASFFVLGLRGETWEPRVFLAIPLVIAFFSYLFAICALVGLVTRSTVASLLVTILLWAVIGGLWGTNDMLNIRRVVLTADARELERRIPVTKDEQRVEEYRSALESVRGSERTWNRVCAIGNLVITPMPKTGATIELLQRELIQIADVPQDDESNELPPFMTPKYAKRSDAMKAIREWKQTQTPLWILGTSLGAEAAILALCVLIFSRRDY